jgi:hypothetical protein
VHSSQGSSQVPPVGCVGTRLSFSDPETNKDVKNKFVKGNCQHCDGPFEFPCAGIGQTVNCPHCERPIILSAVRASSRKLILIAGLSFLAVTLFAESMACYRLSKSRDCALQTIAENKNKSDKAFQDYIEMFNLVSKTKQDVEIEKSSALREAFKTHREKENQTTQWYKSYIDERDAIYKKYIDYLQNRIKKDADLMNTMQAQSMIRIPDYTRQFQDMNRQLWENNQTMIDWKEQESREFNQTYHH